MERTPLEKAKACCKLHDRGTDRLLAAIAAAPEPSGIVKAMNDIYAKCPRLTKIELNPSIILDARSGKVVIKEWSVWLWSGPSQLAGDGCNYDRDAAIAEAVAEYMKNYDAARPPAEVAAANATALEEVERFDPMTGPCGQETDRDRHNDEEAQRAAQARADAEGGAA